MMLSAVAISVLNEKIASRFANARNDELTDTRLLAWAAKPDRPHAGMTQKSEAEVYPP